MDGRPHSRKPGHQSRLALSTADIPTRTENAPIVGEKSIHTLDDLKRHRDNEVAFLLAKLTLEKYFRQDNEQKTDRPSVHRFDADVKGWLFPQVLNISKRWLAECVTCKDNTFPQLLLLVEFAQTCAGTMMLVPPGGGVGQPTVKLNAPVSPPPSLTLIVFAPVLEAVTLNECAPASPPTNV